MRKEIITCDICEKEINESNEWALVKNRRVVTHSIKDCCEDCSLEIDSDFEDLIDGLKAEARVNC